MNTAEFCFLILVGFSGFLVAMVFLVGIVHGIYEVIYENFTEKGRASAKNKHDDYLREEAEFKRNYVYKCPCGGPVVECYIDIGTISTTHVCSWCNREVEPTRRSETQIQTIKLMSKLGTGYIPVNER